MRKRINLLALVVIVAGGTVMARPTPASATMAPGTIAEQFGSCCSATINGTRVAYCCSLTGCQITQNRCIPWS